MLPVGCQHTGCQPASPAQHGQRRCGYRGQLWL